MLPISNLLAFAIAAAVIVAIPGPSVLFTISRALTLGRRAALLTVVGNAVGVSAQVVAVAFGIGAVVERSVVAFTIVKYLGAAYIVYLGVRAVRHRRAFTDGLAQRAAPVTPLRAMRDGAIVGATNPKTIVVFVAFMPGFTDPAAGHLQWQPAAAGIGISRHCAALGQCVGTGGRHRPGVAGQVSTPIGCHRRNRWTRHDRARDEPGRHRPKGLITTRTCRHRRSV